MGALEQSIEKQLELAINCSDLDILWELHKSPYMNVRRAVARNKNIDTKIANELIADPVLNVSYMAKLSCKSSEEKNFECELNECVLCEKSELGLDCLDCERKRNRMLNS